MAVAPQPVGDVPDNANAGESAGGLHPVVMAPQRGGRQNGIVALTWRSPATAALTCCALHHVLRWTFYRIP